MIMVDVVINCFACIGLVWCLVSIRLPEKKKKRGASKKPMIEVYKHHEYRWIDIND